MYVITNNQLVIISIIVYVYVYRIVKRSSYRLNSLILAAAFVGFAGTLLHIIQLDSDMNHTSTAAICNVNPVNSFTEL